jgi:putative restriction endonuclease
MQTNASLAMKDSEEAQTRLAQFRGSLRLPSARKAFDVLLEYATELPGYRIAPPDDPSLHEVHYFDEASGASPFRLSATDRELLFDVHQSGFGRVPGGLPALKAGVGPVSETDSGTWRLRISKPSQADALSRLLFPAGQHESPRVRHWWVNHAADNRAETEGSYLWAAKKPTNGSRSRSHQNMTRVVPGDVVFSIVDESVAAIGIALDRARSAPNPNAASREGWLIPVRLIELNEPLRLKDDPTQRQRLRRPRQSAGAYLVEIPDIDARLLRRLLSRRVEDLEERIFSETEGKLTELAIEEQIWLRADIGARDKQQLSAARLGQGVFRDAVERIETACRVTGIVDRRYLYATHIKPWKAADDREKRDGANGLLLTPHIIHLFDRGHISFADDGALLISRYLNPYVSKAWGLEHPVPPRAFRAEQRVYLDYHRTHVFERVGRGRRSPAETGGA